LALEGAAAAAEEEYLVAREAGATEEEESSHLEELVVAVAVAKLVVAVAREAQMEVEANTHQEAREAMAAVELVEEQVVRGEMEGCLETTSA